MPLDIEEELDLANLGFDVPPRAGLSELRRDDGPSRIGRYASADWTPERIGLGRETGKEEIRPVDEQIRPDDEETRPDDEEHLAQAGSLKHPTRRRGRWMIVRIPGSHARRRTFRKLPTPSVTSSSQSSSSPRSTSSTPPDGFTSDFIHTFGRERFDHVQVLAKLHATTGAALPGAIRDLFPLLADLQTAIPMSNRLRQTLDLEPIRLRKSTKLDLLRAVAKLRETLYTTLMMSLVIPCAPVTEESEEDKEEEESEERITLTPHNIERLSTLIPTAFPQDKVKALDRPYGEQSGRVVWQGGIGRVIGAEVKGRPDGNVHIFLDHSNILHGLLHCLYSNPSDSLPPKHLRTLSLPALSLLLRRGRSGTLHAVASSPLLQDLDPLVRLGWEVSVLKRVEVLQDEVEDPNALNLTPKPVARIPENGGLRRYKEQAVDEILHLKLLQTLNSKPTGRGCTLVLATGDAKGGQFNADGFLGGVKEAIKREWTVELWSFRAGLSRAWIDAAKREGWTGHQLSIHHLDGWSEYLVEVGVAKR